MKSYLRILAFIKPYKGYALLNAIFNILYTLFNLVSVATIVPVLDIIFDTTKRVETLPEFAFNQDAILGTAGYYITKLIDTEGAETALLIICGITAINFLLKNTFNYLALFFLAPLRYGVIHDLRRTIHRKCLDLPIWYFTEKRKGDIMARMSTDVNEIEWTMLTTLEMMVREPLTIIGTFVVLLTMSAKLTLFILLVLPISFFIISTIGKSLKRSSVKAQGQLGYVLSLIEETLTGLRIIKGFNAEDRIQEKFERSSDDYRKTMVRVLNKKDASSPMSEVLGAAVMLMVIWYGGRIVLSGEGMTGGALIAYVVFFYMLIPAFKSFTQAVYNIQKGNASSERILEILDAHNPIKDNEHSVSKTDFNSGIEFKSVNFKYAGSEKVVLKDINFTLSKGRTIALVGPSGSGKTTISNLLPRFYDLEDGAVLIDGVNIRDIKLKDLRGLMGIVNQESILFNDTVKANIALGKPDASLEEIQRAAEVANAHEFIVHLDKGYDTNIGEGGSKLSGGQKQRMSIARAVLEDPAVLILDEATSALDTESERLVQDALNKLMSNRTSLIIAHRLSTIQHADEILVMEEGRIVERGNHDELLSKNGLYAKLVEMQSFA